MTEHDERRDASDPDPGLDAAEAHVEAAAAEVEEARTRLEELSGEGAHGAGGRARGLDADTRLEAARARLEAAREAYFAAREAHRAQRVAERDGERAARDAERAAERAARREERHRVRLGFGGRRSELDLGELLDVGGIGEEFTEEVVASFDVDAMPTLRVRNVAGETRISVRDERAVHVRATKRVRGSSAEKAKRLLQNIEVRMEKHRDEITIRPHLYEQDRGWLELFRAGRASVDLEITLPRESRIEAHTASGDLAIRGARGPVEAQSVSGDIALDDVQGPLWLKTVSGDATCVSYAGAAEVNSVSGDVRFEASSVRDLDIVTVSGDVAIEGVLSGEHEHRIKTISGDVELAVADAAYAVAFRTMSGSLDAPEARVDRDGRKDRTVHLGDGPVRVHVKTVSGDLSVRRSDARVPDEQPAAYRDAGASPHASSATPAASAAPGPDVRDVLDRLARGELDVDAAAAALDEAKGGR